jgi:hypothetical protein
MIQRESEKKGGRRKGGKVGGVKKLGLLSLPFSFELGKVVGIDFEYQGRCNLCPEKR